jgi:cell division protein FtsQ
MKIWLLRIFWLLLFIGVVVIFYFAGQAEQNKVLQTPLISIHAEDENTFLTGQELKDRLQLRKLFRTKMLANELNVHSIERAISAMAEVKEVNVYKHLGDKWEIKLALRKPIARIFNTSGQSYYLDQDGFMMYRSALHTARTLVFSGHIPDAYNPRLHCDFINNSNLY